MANVSPFLDSPGQLVEKLAQVKDERKKLEAHEERLRQKIEAIMAERGVEFLDGETHAVKYEERDSLDCSQKALEETLGEKKWAAIKKDLPRRKSRFLALRALKDVEVKVTDEVQTSNDKLLKHFGGAK